MDRATISRIEEWDTRPISGGYVGLNELAEDDFTGAVATGGAHLFMLNGRVVGVSGGTVASFEDAEATAYKAPDPSLPLLFAMQDHDGEVRGSYYTDDTPIREVDETLSEGGFTGYLELAENVLSGDYYVVYYGGRSLAAAFVGNKGRVVTGDEAFDLAADEVGIYEVTAVDLDVADVPEPPEESVTAGAATPAEEEKSDDEADEDADATTDEPSVEEAVEEDAEPVDSEDEADEDEPVADEPVDEEEPDVGEESAPAIPDAEAGSDGVVVEEAEPEPDGDEGPEERTPAAESGEDASPAAGSVAATETSDAGGTAERQEPRPDEAGSAEPDERFAEEAAWREARTVPALDPDESTTPVEEQAPPDPQPTQSRTVAVDDHDDSEAAPALEERVQRLEAQLQTNERERRRLDERLAEVVEERDDLEAERDALAERIEGLERRLDEAQAAAAAADGDPASTGSPSGGQRVDATTALDQTDLFVRYGSKSKPTLASAHDGRASEEEVAENLRIDSHSRFDHATATVDGRPFEEFLEGTIQYRFVAWLVEVLLYEIRDTGTEAGLRALYDVLPQIDRAEFNGTVTSTDEEGNTSSKTFDVICRDRMGKPLIVANLNDSLDPATGDMMATLVEDGTEVAEDHESIGAAFLVTASFFQPDALETAADATRGGGFLSRDSKKSFVKLSRSGGYHLCLVEARGDDFHVAVPEF